MKEVHMKHTTKNFVTQMLLRDLFAVSDLLLYLSPRSSYTEIHS